MADKFNFERVKNIEDSVQFTVYGYVQRCRKLLPKDDSYYDIPDLVRFMVLFFYHDPDCWDAKCMDDEGKIFEYKRSSDYVHIFGKTKIVRRHNSKHKWIIKTSKGFSGTLGVIHGESDILQRIQNGLALWNNVHRKYVAFVGTSNGGWSGTPFGAGDEKVPGGYQQDADMCSFIKEEDVITIEIDYDENKIYFESHIENKRIARDIKSGVNSLKLVAEFAYSACQLTLMQTH